MVDVQLENEESAWPTPDVYMPFDDEKSAQGLATDCFPDVDVDVQT